MPNPIPRAAAIRSFIAVDLRDAIRSLLATPIVTGVALLSLALGIGANAALFSILDSLVMRQLPVPEPQQLAIVGRTAWTNPIWEQIRDRGAGLFESACAWSAERFNLAASGRVEPVDGAYVSGSLFRTLGVDTAVGRPLEAADDVRGGGEDGRVVVISHRLWQQRFAAAPDALGRRLTVNGVPFTIVGVVPRGFTGPEVGRAMDVFLPLASEADIRGRESALDGRSSWWLQVMVRLRPDQTLEGATAALEALRPVIRDATMPPGFTAEYRAGYLSDTRQFQLVAAPTGFSPLRQRFTRPLTIVMIIVAAVLLIACANVANLMLARASVRRHEMSVRLALGASRLRLGCQLFAESLLLATAGAIAAVPLAHSGAVMLVRQLGSAGDPVALDVSIDWQVLRFTAAVAAGVTVLFGLAPAIRIGGVEANNALKEQNRTLAGDRRAGLRSALIVIQVALSFVLVAGAGLFVRTFTALVNTPLGFDPEDLLIVNVDAGRSKAALEDKAAFGQRLAETVAATPGVSRASLSYLTPLSGRNWTQRVQVAGEPGLPRAEQTTWVNAVAPGWFETYGMRLTAGRDVASSDVAGSEPVAVVNQAFVRRFVGARTPLGLRIRGVGLGQLKAAVIVGVVGDSVYRTARVGVVPAIYLPMKQADTFGPGFSVTAKVRTDPVSLERSLTAALGTIDPSLTFSFRDYTDQLRATTVQERLTAMLSGCFGVLAMLLAALGVYGVSAHSVGRRRREIAVRMAVGATSGGILRLVLRDVARLIACGAIIGAGVSLWAATFVRSLLFGVDARDPLTLSGAATVLVAVGLFAGWLPARIAARENPAEVLRS